MTALLHVHKVDRNEDRPGYNWGVMFTGALIPVYLSSHRTQPEAFAVAYAVAKVLAPVTHLS